MTNEEKRIRDLRRWLKHLTRSVDAFISLIDNEPPKQSRYERGQQLAAWINSLDIHNDQAKHFGLGQKLKKKA